MKVDLLKLNFIYNSRNCNTSKRVHNHKLSHVSLNSDVFVKSLNANNIAFSGYTFDLRNHKGLPCAYCGEKMLTKRDVDEIVCLKGKKLASRIGYYSNQGHNQISQRYLDAINFVRQIAKEYPYKSAAEILPIVYVRARNRMILKQAEVYSAIEKSAQNLCSQDLLNYISKVKSQDKPIPTDISIEDLSYFLIHKTYIKYRKEILSTLSEFAKEKSNPKNANCWKRVLYEASILPSSSNDPDALLVKLVSQALRHDPKGGNEIVSINDDAAAVFYSNLLTEFMPTVEHIKPQSKNGADSSTNFLAVHSHCNGKRGSIPFSEYVSQNPDILRCILNYMSYIRSENLSKVSKFSKIRYLEGINDRLKQEFASLAHNRDVKNFLNSLDDICFITKSKISPPSDQRTLHIVPSILVSKIKNFEEGKSLNRQFDSLLLEFFDRLKTRVGMSYKTAISKLESENKVFAVLELKRRMQKDELLNMQKIDYLKLNTILSDNYIKMHRDSLETELRRLLVRDNEDCYIKFINTLMSNLFDFKSIEGYCIKALLYSRDENGNYRKDKIYIALDEMGFCNPT